jgi:hypothetical protein
MPITRTERSPLATSRILAFSLATLCGSGAFIVNFHALSALATTHGVPAHLSWVWAIVVDLSIVAGTIAHLVLPRSMFVVALFVGAAAFSVAGNTIHGLPYGPVGVVVADYPPIALLALVHLCTKLTQRARNQQPEPATQPEPEPAPVSPATPGITQTTQAAFPWVPDRPATNLAADWATRFPARTRAGSTA